MPRCSSGCPLMRTFAAQGRAVLSPGRRRARGSRYRSCRITCRSSRRQCRLLARHSRRAPQRDAEAGRLSQARARADVSLRRAGDTQVEDLPGCRPRGSSASATATRSRRTRTRAAKSSRCSSPCQKTARSSTSARACTSAACCRPMDRPAQRLPRLSQGAAISVRAEFGVRLQRAQFDGQEELARPREARPRLGRAELDPDDLLRHARPTWISSESAAYRLTTSAAPSGPRRFARACPRRSSSAARLAPGQFAKPWSSSRKTPPATIRG